MSFVTKSMKIFIAIAVTFCSTCLYAGLLHEYKSVSQANNTVSIQLDGATIAFTALNDSAMEVFYQADGVKQLPSFAIAEGVIERNSTITMRNDGEQINITVGNLTAVIDKAPFKISYYRNGTFLVAESAGGFALETMRGFSFALGPDEKLMGAGQRVLGMDRRGHRLPLYNKAHYGYETESTQMYYSLPAVMSTNMYVIGFDNSSAGFIDIGHTQKDTLLFEASAGRTSYIISTGETYAQLVKNFVDVTGKQPLPPRWALGNYASRFGYRTQNEVMQTVAKFKQQDFPLDAVVLDLYWFGPDIKGHMGNLQWDNDAWPAPEKMIAELKRDGVNTIMITEPFILTGSKQWSSALKNQALVKNLLGEPRTFDFYFGNTGLVDVFDPRAQDWFWQFYEALNQQGVAGWWGDLGEPEVHPADSIHRLPSGIATGDEVHNAYGHKWAQMVYQKQQHSRPDERPFVMMRAGFLGSQRYGMIPWTGDVNRSWGGLKPQVELALQMSMFGLAYTHSDLGGFAGGEKFDAELYTRWLQYGVFQPVYRPHAQEHIAPEPIFHDQQTQAIIRDYIKLRYRLLPYNYSLSYENSLTGMPMMRPTFIDSASTNIENSLSYLWGEAFLVTPIVQQGQFTQDIILPDGVWFDFWTGKKYQGGKMHELDAPLEILPVMAKAGAFVPMLVDDISSTQDYSTDALFVHYYADKSVPSASFNLYDDDGIDPNAISKKRYQTIGFEASHDTQLALTATVKGMFDLAPNSRSIEFVIHGIERLPKLLLIDGREVDISDKPNRPKIYGAWYDSSKQVLYAKGVLAQQLKLSIE